MGICSWFGHKWDYLEPHISLQWDAAWWDVHCKRCGRESTYSCRSLKEWFDISHLKYTEELSRYVKTLS